MGLVANLVVVGLLTVGSGLLDARAFVFASRAWPGGHLDLKLALASLAAFAGGIGLYMLAIRFMQNAGIHGTALQSGLWFVVTAVGIATLDGTVRQWSAAQQGVGVAVAIALCWLIASTRAAAAAG